MVRKAPVAGTPVTAGTKWTLYGLEGGTQDFCVVISFFPKVFTSVDGNTGKWSGTSVSTKLTFSDTVDFEAKSVLKFGRVPTATGMATSLVPATWPALTCSTQEWILCPGGSVPRAGTKRRTTATWTSRDLR